MKHICTKFVAMLLVIAMIAGVLPFAFAANVGPFTDVKDTDWFASNVQYVYDNGLMNGTTTTTFEPESNLTRAQTAMVLWRIAGQPAPTAKAPFTDLVDAWYRDAIAWAAEQKVVNGRGDGTFDPNGQVTVAEAGKMVLVALGYNAGVEGYTGGNWQINTDVRANALGLYDDLDYTNTSAALTRDNAAQMLYNALDCKMVTYDYIITGTVDNAITTKPQLNDWDMGTLLWEKFKAVKLEGVVVANEYADLDSTRKDTDKAPKDTVIGSHLDSGKTTVLIHRIANLIRYGCASDSTEVPPDAVPEDIDFLEEQAKYPTEEGVQRADALCALRPAAPWSILAITFTNKAANELRERLTDLLGPEANDVWAMTFHSACCRILRREIERLGYDRSFTIYDTADSERVMKDLLRERGLDEKTFPPRAVLAQISRLKDQMQTPEEFLASVNSDYRLKCIGQLYASYQRRLQEANAVDFDDIILLTVRLLQEYEDVRDYYQRKFRYVLIDEYQDTNHLQYLLASLLAGRHENICVVGDDDQSIYRFRGATIENILNFENEYQGARLIRLEQNYRSTQCILDAANAVIANNHSRKGKKLWTENGQGDRVRIYEASDGVEEANYVANRILTDSHGQNYGDFAVLYRMNAQSNALEYAFKRNGIPYRIIGGTRFFDRAEVKDMLAYLCLINNRADDLRLRRIINQPPRGIGGKTLEVIERQSAAEGRPLYSVLCNARSYPALERAEGKLQQFAELIESCVELSRTMPLPEFYDELLIRTGYAAMLEQKGDVESRTRLENVRELRSSILTYLENADAPSLSGFLEEIALYTDIEQYDRTADAVVMMTVHSAKGLEFPEVYLVGAEDGLFPSARAIGEPEEMEEERRLCYVAITRAKRRLTITCAHQRMLYGRTTVSRPSRFLAEIPEELVERKQHTQPRFVQQAKPRPRPTMPHSDTLGSHHASGPVIDFRKGDTVEHDVFGRGLVLSVLPTGNDKMLEIAFDQIGTKRLMANFAASRMRKL